MREITIYSSENHTGAEWCTEHTGKMAGVPSLSTSPFDNPKCCARCKVERSICFKCYSFRVLRYRAPLAEKLHRNTLALTNEVYPIPLHPVCNNQFARFESFGDLITWQQCANYFNMCYRNPKCMFALWTKNLDIIIECFAQGYKKPSNLIIIQSSVWLNQEEEPRFSWVDKVFTVYSKQYVKEHPNLFINCGAKNCLGCQLCYHKDSAKLIHEVAK